MQVEVVLRVYNDAGEAMLASHRTEVVLHSPEGLPASLRKAQNKLASVAADAQEAIGDQFTELVDQAESEGRR